VDNLHEFSILIPETARSIALIASIASGLLVEFGRVLASFAGNGTSTHEKWPVLLPDRQVELGVSKDAWNRGVAALAAVAANRQQTRRSMVALLMNQDTVFGAEVESRFA
jgi:hypothetical protein